MMKLGYCSPFSPIKSGISDFSEELIVELKKYLSIDIFYEIEPDNNEIREEFNCYPLNELHNSKVRNKYDAIVYHMGNNIQYHQNIADMFLKYSGFIELHDFSLHNFLAADTFLKNDVEGYLQVVRYSHGEMGVKTVQKFLDGKTGAPWETHALELSVNKHYLDRAEGVIVHSDLAKQMVKSIKPNVTVVNIPLHTTNIINNPVMTKVNAKKKLNIDDKTYIFGSFGYATRAKRILQILEALAKFSEIQSIAFHYYIVGKVDGINVKEKVCELGLQNKVTVTGFTTLEEFNLYMNACDICFNLRYPTHGESSASLHRMFGMGKPVIVSHIGSFDEYPENIVIKVRYDNHEIQDIYNAICRLTKNKKELAQRGKNALQFAIEKCDISKNAKLYADYFYNVRNKNYHEEYMENIIDRLFDLGLTDDLYITHLLQSLCIDK